MSSKFANFIERLEAIIESIFNEMIKKQNLIENR